MSDHAETVWALQNALARVRGILSLVMQTHLALAATITSRSVAMALEVGSQIAHYSATALIGEGGMGQAWQATDTKLNRQVALKILPDAFASDPDRLARFERDAQVETDLNHPGIVGIYGLARQERSTKALASGRVEKPVLSNPIVQTVV